MTEIADIYAREILDSRGNPTVEVDVILETGVMAVHRARLGRGLCHIQHSIFGKNPGRGADGVQYRRERSATHFDRFIAILR